MDWQEQNIKLLTGELSYTGGIYDSFMSKVIDWAIKEYKILREALNDCYNPIIAEIYFELVNALLIYKERLSKGETK